MVAAVTGYWVLQPVIRDPLASDFTLAFIAVRIGTEHGWSHIYSLQLQHQLFSELRPGVFFNDGQRYIAPPPLAWVTLPLGGLGAEGAFYSWFVLSVASLVAAWWIGAPGRGLEKAVWLIGAIAWYPVLYGLQYGQPALVVLLTVIVAWRLAESRPYVAGLVLAVGTSFKPQLVLAVPLVLLFAGRWRVAAAWVAATGVLAAVSLLTLGSNGLADYRSLLAEAQTLPNNRYFTWAYVVGPGTLSYLLQGAVLVLAAAGGYLNRKASTGRLVALGLVAGTVGATYWHLQDFTTLVGAAWLFWRDNPPAWQRIWVAAVTAVTIELAWPLTPLPLLIASAIWLGLMCVPARSPSPTPG